MFSIIYFFIFYLSSVSAEDLAQPLEITDRDLRTWSLSSDILEIDSDEQSLFRDSSELLSLVSNSNVAGGTNRMRFFQLRGVGEVSQYENTPTHSISYLVDGVDVTGVLSHWPLLEVATFVVEKQPSTIYFGGQAIGGAVYTTLYRAGDEGRSRASIDARGAHAADLSIPLGGHRLALHYNSDPGFIKNTYYAKPGDSRREAYASLASNWWEGNSLRVQSTVLWSHANNRYDVWSLDNTRSTFSDHPGKDNLAMGGASLNLKYQWDSGLRFEMWSSQVLADSTYSYDSDWGNNAYWNSVPGWSTNYDYFDEFLRERRQGQMRLQLASDLWNFAIHTQNLRESSDSNSYKNSLQRSGVVGDFRQRSHAVHGSYIIDLSSRLRWINSVRYDVVQTEYRDYQTINEKDREPQLGISSQVEFQWNEAAQTQFSIHRGYKNPMINIDPDTPAVDRHVGSESAVHVEIAHRYNTPSLQITSSLFAREAQDQHVRVSRQLDMNDPSSYVYYHDNAATTRYWGYELSGETLGFYSSRWRWSLGVLDARFRDYVFDGQILSDRTVAYAPRQTWALQWMQPISHAWQTSLQWEGKSGFYYSNNHGQKNSGYDVFHAALQWSAGEHEWDLGVRNVLDRDFAIRAFYFANEPPDFPEKLYLQYGAPRTVYMNYRMRF